MRNLMVLNSVAMKANREKLPSEELIVVIDRLADKAKVTTTDVVTQYLKLYPESAGYFSIIKGPV